MIGLLQLLSAYIVIGFLLIGFLYARNGWNVCLGEFVLVTMLWPLTATFAYTEWFFGSSIVSKVINFEVDKILQKVFGKPGGGK